MFYTPYFVPKTSWWLGGSAVDLDFAGGRYYDNTISAADLTANTVLMLHGDGTDGSTNISDSTGRQFCVPYDAAVDTAQSKFGGSSLYFTNDRIEVTSPDMAFGTGEFTVDCWFRIDTTVVAWEGIFATTFENATVGITVYVLPVSSDFVIRAEFRPEGTSITATTLLAADTWYHVAIVRSGTTTALYINGVSEGTPLTDTHDYTHQKIYVGNWLPSTGFTGWIDEFRVIKGVAAWTANFTAPTAPYNVGIGAYDVLSCSRASIGYAQTAAGTLTQFAANQLRITDLGLLVEDTRTNDVIWNRDLTNAAWTPTNITAVKDQVGPDGVNNSASSITASAGNGTILQSITAASAGRFQTAWVKRITGTGTINMTMDNGATWTAITVTSSWTSVSIPAQTLANPVVGFRIVTNADAIAVDFVQNEIGTFATSPIPTTTAAAARAADAVTMVDNLNTLLSSSSGSVMIGVQENAAISCAVFGKIGAGFDLITYHIIDLAAIQVNGLMAGFAVTLGNSKTSTDNVKLGISWDGINASAVGAGGTVTTQLSSYAGGSSLKLGGAVTGYEYSFGYFKRFTAWNSRLADATLQSLTAP